jgi:large subunit ribosomal protein L22
MKALVFVDSGRVLKRILPAPQGRAHRMKKRSNHVTMILDSRNFNEEISTPQVAVEEPKVKEPKVKTPKAEVKTTKTRAKKSTNKE